MKNFNLKKLSNILRQYYSEPMVKGLRTGSSKPSREKSRELWHEWSLNDVIWDNVMAWRENDFKLTDEQIELERKAWNRLGYDLVKLEDRGLSNDNLLEHDIVLVGESVGEMAE